MDKAEGNASIILDADLQDPPELIPKMIAKWEEGYQIVYGKRVTRRGETKFKRWTASFFYWVLNKLTDIEMPSNVGDFRLIDKRVVQEMRKIKEKNRYIRGLSSWVGFRQIGIEYEREERFAGKTKYPLRKMFKFALDGFFSFSQRPLKIALNIGFFSIFVGILMIVYVFIRIILKDYTP